MKDKSLPKLPYINFFQYPPLMAKKDADCVDVMKEGVFDGKCSDPTYAIFISTPYCRVRCHSCPYFKAFLPKEVDQVEFLDEYVKCLEAEISEHGKMNRFSDKKCGAIYFGGGTASLLSPDQVKKILSIITRNFNLDADVEITLEGNPNEFSQDGYLIAQKKAGVNRVSIGFQSVDQGVLTKLNSPHKADKGILALHNALQAGFNSVNVDLLFGVPDQTESQCKSALEYVVNLKVPSIKIYPYIIHSDSASEKMINRGLLGDQAKPDEIYEWCKWARSVVENEGYVEGRNGSFYLPGHKQKYGYITYEKGYELIGVGAGAYSYMNNIQYANSPDPERYKQKILNKMFPAVEKMSRKATNDDLMRRFLIFGFFSSSIDKSEFTNRFLRDPEAVYPNQFSWLEENEFVKIKDNKILLTDLGKQWRKHVLYEFYNTAV